MQIKNKENRGRKPPAQIFKYITPAHTLAPKATISTKGHSRSMVELDGNIPIVTPNHHHHASIEPKEEGLEKNNSLSKFMNVFSNVKGFPSKPTQAKQTQKPMFTCNVKSVTHRPNEGDIKSTLVLKNQKQSGREKITNQSFGSVKVSQTVIPSKNYKMESCSNAEQTKWKEMEDNLELKQRQIEYLREQIKKVKQEKDMMQEEFSIRERDLAAKLTAKEKPNDARKCKEHELIIQSLKKVINDQLQKIIEFEKRNIEREQIEQLEQCLSRNMNDVQSELQCDSQSQSGKSRQQECPLDSARLTEQSQTEGDSILEEVDEYLSHWRRKD